MASSYPSTQDNFTNPTASDKTNSVTVPHATQHANVNDAVEALERKVGFSSSTSGAGIVSPSSSVGDVFYVSDTSGRTRYGPAAMVKIGEYVSTSTGVAAVSFTGIRQDFGALMVTGFGRSTSTGTFLNLQMQMNADTSTNYDYQNQQGGPGGASTGAEVFGSTAIHWGMMPASTAEPLRVGHSMATILGYASTFHKATLAQRGVNYLSTTNGMRASQTYGTWRSTAAITRLDFLATSGGFALGSKFKLYGLPE